LAIFVLLIMTKLRQNGKHMSVVPSPKLIVCDVDDSTLSDASAQNSLLETWVGWPNGDRPLILYHSTMDVGDLDRRLLATTLPPADFLLGGGASMLVRLERWRGAELEAEPKDESSSRRGPGQLIEEIMVQARQEIGRSAAPATEFPRVQSVVLTAAGLLVVFAAGEKVRRRNPNAVISWIVQQLQFEPGDVRSFAATIPARTSTARAKAR
jgi:hypothetical protein